MLRKIPKLGKKPEILTLIFPGLSYFFKHIKSLSKEHIVLQLLNVNKYWASSHLLSHQHSCQ